MRFYPTGPCVPFLFGPGLPGPQAPQNSPAPGRLLSGSIAAAASAATTPSRLTRGGQQQAVLKAGTLSFRVRRQGDRLGWQ